MNPIFESSLMYNPIDTSETYGGSDGMNITEVRTDFNFSNFTTANFKAETWKELKAIFKESSENIWNDLYNLIVDKSNNPKVEIKSRTCKCAPTNTRGSIICPDNTPNLNMAGMAYKLLDGIEYNDIYKNVEVQRLYLNLKEDVNGVNIFFYSAKDNLLEGSNRTYNLKKGKNDLLQICQVKQPFLLDPTKERCSFIAIIPSQFIVNGKSILDQTVVPCPSCVKKCHSEYIIYGTSNTKDASKYTKVVTGANVNNYGFEIVTTAVCDVARIIEDNTTKFQLASLQAIYMMGIFARNTLSSNNVNAKIAFGRQATIEDAKSLSNAYNEALRNVANTIFNKVADGAKSDCILCKGRVVGRSSF